MDLELRVYEYMRGVVGMTINKIVRVVLSVVMTIDMRKVLELPLCVYLHKEAKRGTEEWAEELTYIIRSAEALVYSLGMAQKGAIITVTGEVDGEDTEISKVINHYAVTGDAGKEYGYERCLSDLLTWVSGETFLRVQEWDLDRDREAYLVEQIFGKNENKDEDIWSKV